MIINKIIKYLNAIFYIPSTIVFVLVLIIKMIKNIEITKEIVNNGEKLGLFINDNIEEFRDFGKHINYAFWIFIIYIVYF